MNMKPILFSTPMVQAILAGRKTMTRRVVEPQPKPCNHSMYVEAEWKNEPSDFIVRQGEAYCRLCGNGVKPSGSAIVCPYGKVGDVLWVKETHWVFGEWEPNGSTKTGKQRMEFKRHIDADVRFTEPRQVESLRFKRMGWYKRPSLFLEKRYARIFLQITNIRVERLQDISDDDAIAEGIEPIKYIGVHTLYKSYTNDSNGYLSPCNSFNSLWRSINGEESWNANPFVWVVEFKQVVIPTNP